MIERKPGVCGGRPVLAGTRILAKDVKELMIKGWTDEQILDGFQTARPEHLAAIRANLAARHPLPE